ncbi:MAG: gamma-glutamylcyclotransferase family protein [Candidatus Alcyoniella australis]|nr:gamma-glutamylcyclotransferase family protein [Candidatus Alcyoniella australis]
MRGERHVFVCGALQNPEKLGALLGRSPAFAPAVVKGYQRGSETIGGVDVAFMLPSTDPVAVLTGVVWLDLSEQDIELIEGLELAGDLRKRIVIEAVCGELRLKAFTYVKA